MSIDISDMHKLPRLYFEEPFTDGAVLRLEKEQAHYLLNVLRRKNGDQVRVFNGMDGEYLAGISALSKKSGEITLTSQIRPQPDARRSIALVFAPVKKNRQDILIEKGVELGVDAFYPVIMDHGQINKIKNDRIEKQIIEAAEQCERLTIPQLYEIAPLTTCLEGLSAQSEVVVCTEREQAQPVADLARELKDKDIAIVIGPEGGLSEDEIALSRCHRPASLGETILRTETAAVAALSIFKLT